MRREENDIDVSGPDDFEYIELGRTFHELSKYASQDDSVDITQAFHVGEQLSWASLTKEHRVIILAEAGSGKTAEIRHVAQRLHHEGKPSFFLRLENIPSAFELAFEIEAGSYQDFRVWREGSGEGWIFLDSVDEAKLRNPRDFELAITKLAQQIGSAKDRSHIIITGRTTAWRPKSDLAYCQRYLPYGGPVIVHETGAQSDGDDELDDVFQTEAQNEPTESVGFKICTLDDLATLQIERFIAARGINNTKAFLEAVERADAWSFTTRPQDLEDLTAFWLREGRIGSRLEIMVNSIERRLSERDQSRDEARPLAMDAAQEGAQLLAAATTLSKETNIRVPDGAANTTGIAVGAVLPDWDQRQQRTLLERPIFDEVIYEAVRFHHRSVREYLTARWFAFLLEHDTSRRQIESMFFREQYGVAIVTPTLRPILPWLMLMDNRIKARVLETAPEIAFEGGDPSQLPVEDRRRILRDVCAQIAAGTAQRSAQDYAAVQRFSGPDLVQDVRDLLRENEQNDELAAFLLRMVWLGQLKEALPDVMTIALTPGTEGYKRMTAFRALNAIGSEADQRRVRERFHSESEQLDRDLLAELIEHLEPTPENTAWLVEAVAKSAAKDRHSVDRLSDHLGGYIGRAPLDLVATMVRGLLPLLSQPPVIERRHNDISKRFEWLLVPAARAVERLIAARHPAALETSAFAIMRMMSVARVYQSEELFGDKIDFTALVSSWPELNKALFWFEVQKTRETPVREGDRMINFWQASFRAHWNFGEADFGYASDEIANQQEQDNKLVALSLAFDLYRRFNRPPAWRKKLKSLTSGNEELSERLQQFLKPPAQPEQRRWKEQERKWKKRREAHEAKQAKYHADWKTYLEINCNKLVADQKEKPGEGINAVWYLFNCTREDRHSAGRWTEYNWHKLIPRFGEPIARLFRDAAVAFWRHYRPKLQSEGASDNQTANGTILGLTGLEIESHETPGWPNGLSAGEVELACRYASFELNGFPTWFPKLFETYPEIVGNFLLREISYELSVQKPDVDSHYIISDVSWSGQWCWDWIAPRIRDLLKVGEPVNLNTLGKFLKILQGSSLPDGEVAALASEKCASLGDNINAALWFAVWTGVDPDAAIPQLSARLDGIADREKRVEFAMSYVTHLSSGRRGEHGAARGAFHTPRHLKSLYILINEHVRREDDIERAGKGVFSPGLRDNAQDARNGLIELLLKIPGKEAYLAIRGVADAFPDRPWFARLAREHAERDGDLDPIRPEAVRELADSHEKTPSNHRELAALAEARLLDLKDELENGDTSIAGILRNPDIIETDMRKYIGKELRDKAHGRYNIPQEEELANAQKPDLRFHGVGFDGPVPCELKLVDKGWSGADLLERLENQLCGDYLRDNRSNRGFFVLVYQGIKSAWDLPGGRADFEGLVAALQRKWTEISSNFPGIDDIKVIGIDLAKRDQ